MVALHHFSRYLLFVHIIFMYQVFVSPCYFPRVLFSCMTRFVSPVAFSSIFPACSVFNVINNASCFNHHPPLTANLFLFSSSFSRLVSLLQLISCVLLFPSRDAYSSVGNLLEYNFLLLSCLLGRVSQIFTFNQVLSDAGTRSRMWITITIPKDNLYIP